MDLVNGTPEAINQTHTLMHCPSTQGHGNLFMHIVLILGMIVGLPGNILALCIFCFRIKLWKPHTLFLFNLVLADFLLLISVPFRIGTYLPGNYWVFGEVWCHINLFMLAVNRSASIAFMTLVALDRYFKVVHPHHCISHMTLTQAGWLAGLTWTVVVVLRIPMVTINLFRQDGNVTECRSFNSYEVMPLAIKVHSVTFVAEFFLPWFLLLFCSGRIMCFLHQRRTDWKKMVRRAIQAVVVISLVFTICFMPSVITGLVGVYIKYFSPKDCNTYHLFTQLFKMCIGFTYLNSAFDPVIYSFSSSIYRDALRSFISHLGLVRKKNVRAENSTDIY